MKICIDIYSLENRGDWLMFSSILEEVRKRSPRSLISVPRQTFVLAKPYYKKCGVVPLYRVQGIKDKMCMLLERMGEKFGRRRRRIYDCEADVVLFSPGFKYSDQITYRTEAIDRCEIEMWKGYSKKGRKIVFMPQAFGPFEQECNRSHIRRVCEFADHIYAREETSFRYITEALGESAAGKVSVAPDFTCIYKGEPYSLPFKEKDYVVIIPNRQMLAKTGVGGNYCDFIIKVVRFLRENGIKTVFLNHEGEGDGFLISVFNAYIGNSGHVVTNVSGGECKKVISGARLVLTARFHGLVSALSEGVPVLCTSWSHKYQELVNEMGCGNSCVDISSHEEAFGVFLDSFKHPDKYSSPTRNRLVLAEKIKMMWDEIFSLCERCN